MRKKDDFLKKITICLLVFLLLFTVTVLWLFYKTGGMEPTTLVAAVFGATIGELGFCTFIRKMKSKEESGEEDEQTD